MVFMRPFRRHRAWAEQLDAYLDGELTGKARERFEAHLAGCGACESEMVARRELKQMVRSLPVLPVTRSFQITPGMLVEAPAAAERRSPVMARVAQFATGVAALGFVAVLVADVSSGGGGMQAATGDLDADTGVLMESAGEGDRLSGGGEVPLYDSGSDPEPDIQLPPATDGGVGSQGVDPTPQAGMPDDQHTEDDGGTGAANEDSPQRDEGPRPVSAGGEASPQERLASRTAGDEGGVDGMLIAQLALGSLTVVAAVTWLLMRRSGAS